MTCHHGNFNTKLKIHCTVKCYNHLLDFIMLFVSSRAKVTTGKCSRVIYIMTVAGICKCNTDWYHTHTRTYLPQHCGIQMNTEIVLMLPSSMMGEKKKKGKTVSCYHSNTDHAEIKSRSWKALIHCCIPPYPPISTKYSEVMIIF